MPIAASQKSFISKSDGRLAEETSVGKGERKLSGGILKLSGDVSRRFNRNRLKSVSFDDLPIRLDARDTPPPSNSPPMQARNDSSSSLTAVNARRVQDLLQSYEQGENYAELSSDEIADCILAAIHKNDIREVNRIYETENVDINLSNSCGETGLFLAVCYGRLEIARDMLGRDADVNIPDDQGNTPLHEAAELADADMALLLLEEGGNTNLNAKNCRGETALHIAAQHDYVEIAKKLLRAGASPNVRSDDGRTPFLTALDDGSCAVCRLFLRNSTKCGLNLQAVDHEGSSALFIAIKSPYLDDVDVIKELIDTGYSFENDVAWLKSARRPEKFSHNHSLWKRIKECLDITK